MDQLTGDNLLFHNIMSIPKINRVYTKEANTVRLLGNMIGQQAFREIKNKFKTHPKATVLKQAIVNIYKKSDDTGLNYTDGKGIDIYEEIHDAQKMVDENRSTVDEIQTVKHDPREKLEDSKVGHDSRSNEESEEEEERKGTEKRIETQLPAKPYYNKLKYIQTKPLEFKKSNYGMTARNTLSRQKVKLTLWNH
jgi:hypothetical protein